MGYLHKYTFEYLEHKYLIFKQDRQRFDKTYTQDLLFELLLLSIKRSDAPLVNKLHILIHSRGLKPHQEYFIGLQLQTTTNSILYKQFMRYPIAKATYERNILGYLRQQSESFYLEKTIVKILLDIDNPESRELLSEWKLSSEVDAPKHIQDKINIYLRRSC